MKVVTHPPRPRDPIAVEERIVSLRGHRVLLDKDLARLYGVTTKAFNQAVRRNLRRFPEDFSFVLTWDETRALWSQTVTLERGRGAHRKYPPRAFTEQGVAMLSSILRSDRAVSVNIEIVRAFVRLRRLATTHVGIARRIDALERKYDGRFEDVFKAIRALMGTDRASKRKIGFVEPD